MPDKFNELLLKPDIIELYNEGITPNYGYLLNGRFEKDMVKTLYPLKTLNGNPITWEASETEYLFPNVSLQPKQAGSGDPSPENVRPISGWDEVAVDARGAQLCDVSQIVIGGLVGSDGKEYTTKNRIRTPFIYVVAGQTYTLSGYSGLNIANAHCYDENQNWMGSFSIKDNFTVRDGASYVRFSFSKPDQSNFTDSDLEQLKQTLMFNFGSTPTPFEPYQGDTYEIALPETVYGGTVDAVTGAGSKTWGFIASYNGESLPGEWISDRGVYASGTTPTTGAQVAYKLTTPEPFQATGDQALTIQPGNHTIYTDGDNISLTRKAWRLEV